MADEESALNSLLEICKAAKLIEGDTLCRLALNTSAACEGTASAVSSVINSVSQAVQDVQRKARRLCASRDKRLEWQCEEFDAVKSFLECFECQLCVHDIDLDAIEESVWTAGQLLGDVNFLPSSTILACDASPLPVLAGMSHVQQRVDAAQSVVSHPRFLKRGEEQIVTVSCRDEFGVDMRSLRTEDVTVRVSEEGVGWSVSEPAAQHGTVSVKVTPAVEAAQSVTLLVDIVDGAQLQVTLQAGSSIDGTYARTLPLVEDKGHRGIAINSDCTVMAVSNVNLSRMFVYGLPDGGLFTDFGGSGSGPGHFKFPQKMCFAPHSGNLLIADRFNTRVQEVTLAGAHVRTIGEGVLPGDAVGVAASNTMIAVSIHSVFGVGSEAKGVWLFDIVSGDLLRSFGEEGEAEGQLDGCMGLRFTPDGDHILIAEYENRRLSLFTLTGAFVRCVGVGKLTRPADVDFASSGDIVVCDMRNDRVHVFAPDGTAVLRSFGSYGGEPGLFTTPAALAMHSNALYVLDQESARVQVFT